MTKTKTAIGVSLIGAFLLGAILVAYPSAQESKSQMSEPHEKISTSFSDLEEEEIGALVRAYLMENPEVIIEAVNKYSEQERMAAQMREREFAGENLAALLSPEHGYVTGGKSANAKVAVIELFDYHCGFCKRATGVIKDITKNDSDVKVVFRELPILREESHFAAAASLAAREQGKYLDLHFAMMKATGTLTKSRIEDIARKQGIDVAKLEKAADSAEVEEAIIATRQIAEEMGIDGTPAFIIATTDGSFIEVVSGFREEDLREKIAAAKASL